MNIAPIARTMHGPDRIKEILLIEDNPGDVKLIQHAFERKGWHANFSHVSDGDAAMCFLNQEREWSNAPTPELIFLDLNLPRKDGRQILKEIRADHRFFQIPVCVLTSSELRDDLDSALRYEANFYFTKPSSFFDYERILHEVEKVLHAHDESDRRDAR
jgi:two-component system, chemotaxis family, response regulator Rcp1